MQKGPNINLAIEHLVGVTAPLIEEDPLTITHRPHPSVGSRVRGSKYDVGHSAAIVSIPLLAFLPASAQIAA